MDQLINLKHVTITSKGKYMLCLTENFEFFLKCTLIYTIKMPSLKHIYLQYYILSQQLYTKNVFNIGNYVSVVLIKLQLSLVHTNTITTSCDVKAALLTTKYLQLTVHKSPSNKYPCVLYYKHNTFLTPAHFIYYFQNKLWSERDGSTFYLYMPHLMMLFVVPHTLQHQVARL